MYFIRKMFGLSGCENSRAKMIFLQPGNPKCISYHDFTLIYLNKMTLYNNHTFYRPPVLFYIIKLTFYPTQQTLENIMSIYKTLICHFVCNLCAGNESLISLICDTTHILCNSFRAHLYNYKPVQFEHVTKYAQY